MIFNPYLVFDAPMSADFETLRATYRRLARENHPDVAENKLLATERMAQINRAWAILGDEAKRAAFDLEWRNYNARQARQEFLQQEARRRQHSRPASARPVAVAYTSKSAPRGTKSTPKPKSKTVKAPPKRGTGLRAKLGFKSKKNAAARSKIYFDAAWSDDVASPRALRLMRKVTLASRLWHRDGNARVAVEMCRAVLLSDGRNVPARELLSEIFASQGRLDVAVMMLDQALQITPEDNYLRRKRELLEANRFPSGQAPPLQRLSLWQRLRMCLGK